MTADLRRSDTGLNGEPAKGLLGTVDDKVGDAGCDPGTCTNREGANTVVLVENLISKAREVERKENGPYGRSVCKYIIVIIMMAALC